jgi:hypothetical protein
MAPPLDVAALGLELVTRLARALPEREFVVDEERGGLVILGERSVPLAGALEALEETLHEDEPPSLERALDDLADEIELFITGDVTGSWEHVGEAVYAQLFHRGERELAIRVGRLPPHEAEAPHMPVHETLGLHLIVETLFGPLVLHLDTLEALGVDFEQALRTAQANLAELGLEATREPTPGLLAFESDDGYGSARLLCADAALDPFETTLAFAPTQDLFFLVDAGDEAALLALGELAAATCVPGQTLCPHLMARIEGTWRPIGLPADHPAAAPLARVAADITADLYRRQGEAIAAALEEGVRQGDPAALVVQPTVEVGADGLPCLVCELGPQTPVILPVTDEVQLAGVGGDRRLTFTELVERCGGILHELNTHPPRVAVDGPLAELLADGDAHPARSTALPPDASGAAAASGPTPGPRGASLAGTVGAALIALLGLLLLFQLLQRCG